MKHFSDEAWLDFARNVLSPEEMSPMRAHLESGCESCKEVHELWKSVIEMAGRESKYEPDSAVLSAVKRAYREQSGELVSTLAARIAEIVFDSFAAAGATAGIRSISSAARHLVYRDGTLTIDVRLDDYGGRSMTIAGQVLQTEAEAISAGRGEVYASRGDVTLARTATNAFGEFQFEIERGPDLQIRLDISGHQPVMLTLPD